MPRPINPYSRRNVKSYERDKEYLIRLRSAIWLDHTLDSTKVDDACRKIDELLVALRDMVPRVPANGG